MTRGGSRAVATSKMEHFVMIVNGWNPLTIVHKALHLGCCSGPRSASDDCESLFNATLGFRIEIPEDPQINNELHTFSNIF